MADQGRLAISVTHADGRVTRWGPGEQTDRLLNDLSFSSSSPGGFRELSCSLLRGLRPQADEQLLDTVTVYGPGNRIVWEGRVQQLPRDTGSGDRLSPAAVGWSAHLEDRKSVRQIYVDRDMGAWGDMPLNEKVRQLATHGRDIGTLSWSTDGGGLVAALPNQAVGAQAIAAAWYRPPAGVLIAKLMYRGALTSLPGGWLASSLFSATSDGSAGEITTALTLDDTLRTVTPASAKRFQNLQVYANGTAATPAAGAAVRYSKLAAYGNHGLTTRAIAGEPDGLYASDIIGHAITTYAPLLAYTADTLQPTTFAIPQAAYPTPTTAAAIIADVNKYHGWDWLVYDNRTFYYQEAGSGTEWRARRADGAHLRLDGESSDVILNALYVAYSDGFGNQRLAGPPGSGADVEDATLAETSDTHPVNEAGIPEKSDVLQLSQPTTDTGAVLIGSVALYARNAATRRGQITVSNTIEHPTEGKVPVWRVRAGDTIIVGDLPNDVARRIIAVDYRHGDRTAVLTLDNTPAMLEALMERDIAGKGGL